MTITEDRDGSFMVRIKDGETMYVKAHINIYNKPAMFLKYYRLGSVILTESVNEKWWWKYFLVCPWDRVIEQFLVAGKAKSEALSLEEAKLDVMSNRIKGMLKDE